MKTDKNLTRILVISTIVTILLICVVNTICVLCICCPQIINILIPGANVPTKFMDSKVESTLLSTGLSIIGIAVSVWAALNIINMLERKEYDSVKVELKELKDELTNSTISVKEILTKQNQTDKIKLINEMYDTIQDLSTKVLIVQIRKLQEPQDIDYLQLVEIERTFKGVYHLHQSGSTHDEELLMEAYKGIELSEEILRNSSAHSTIRSYLEYRIAEFNFYSGYCCKKFERKKYFDNAIEIYLRVYTSFGAQLPIYNPKWKYFDNNFKECSNKTANISAYFCNSIGEAYSKIIEVKDHIFLEDNEIEEYKKKAVFYCAYASRWGNRETYWRNLGCAIERCYGVSEQTYNNLYEIYNKALNMEANEKSFKVILSVYEKYFNNYLNIEKVDIKEGRKTPLRDVSYKNTWDNFDKFTKEKLLEILSNINEKSMYAKTIYPSKELGYVYSCIYHRNMCLINGDNYDIAKNHLIEAEKEIKVVKIIAPKGVLTKILESDLASLAEKL